MLDLHVLTIVHSALSEMTGYALTSGHDASQNEVNDSTDLQILIFATEPMTPLPIRNYYPPPLCRFTPVACKNLSFYPIILPYSENSFMILTVST